MNTELRNQIIERLSWITGPSFIAYCIQVFVKDAKNKTDQQVIDVVTGLQDQMKDNSAVMREVMGREYNFFETLELTGVIECQ